MSAVIVEGGAGDAFSRRRRGDEMTARRGCNRTTWRAMGFITFTRRRMRRLGIGRRAWRSFGRDGGGEVGGGPWPLSGTRSGERAFAEARTDAEVTSDALDALKAHTSVDVTRIKLPGLKSWYYEDGRATGRDVHRAELMAWRSMLPMELRLFEHGDEAKETTLADVWATRRCWRSALRQHRVTASIDGGRSAQHALREARSEVARTGGRPRRSRGASERLGACGHGGSSAGTSIMRGADPRGGYLRGS